MNICIVNPGFKMGGAERITIELANSLSEIHQVSLVDFTGDNEYFYSVDPTINVNTKISRLSTKSKIIRKILNFNYKITKKSFDPIYIYKEQVFELIKLFKQKNFDFIVMCQGELTSFIPFIKSQFPKLRIIAWQHNNFNIYTKKYYKNIINNYLLGIEQANGVVCLTENDAEKFKKINSKSLCIYNPLTIETPIISDVSSNNIIFVGRLLMQQKGLDFLLKLARNIDDEWKILVAGDGADKKKFEKMISSSLAKNKIVLKGNLSANELKKFYSNGSIFISTSRWEGFGLVITEAMASGLPVISFKTLGPTEILLEGKYGLLVEKYDLEDFTNKLVTLTRNYKLRKYWKDKSLERAKTFKKEKIIDKWEELFINFK